MTKYKHYFSELIHHLASTYLRGLPNTIHTICGILFAGIRNAKTILASAGSRPPLRSIICILFFSIVIATASACVEDLYIIPLINALVLPSSPPEWMVPFLSFWGLKRGKQVISELL